MDAYTFFDKYDKCPFCGEENERSLAITTPGGRMTYSRVGRSDVYTPSKNMKYLAKEYDVPSKIGLSSLSVAEGQTITFSVDCYQYNDPSLLRAHRCTMYSHGYNAGKYEIKYVTHDFHGFEVGIWTDTNPGEETYINRNKKSFWIPQVPFDYFDFSCKEALHDQIDKLSLLL